MKLPKRVLAALAGGALTIGATTPAHAWYYQSDYQRGYNSGYNNGRNSGYSSGYKDGESQGYNRGESRGKSIGYSDGFDNGKSVGIEQGYDSGLEAGLTQGFEDGYAKGTDDGFASGKTAGLNEGYDNGYEVGYEAGRDYEQTLIANQGSAPPLAVVPDLTAGMAAPTLDVGSKAVSLGTVSYSNSIGSADAFSVGAVTNIGATANATSTPDYKVSSTAKFGIGANTMINQVIGSSVGDGSKVVSPTSPITGSFNKSYSPDTVDNTVKVSGIGTDSTIQAGRSSQFKTDIQKGRTALNGSLINPGAGSATGSAGGSVGTTTTASANSSQFVSSFAQAY